MMDDKRYKQLMEQVGMPNSKSLLLALKQVANEVEQEVRAQIMGLVESGSSQLLTTAESNIQMNILGGAFISCDERLPSDDRIVVFGEPGCWMAYGSWDKQKGGFVSFPEYAPSAGSVATHWIDLGIIR